MRLVMLGIVFLVAACSGGSGEQDLLAGWISAAFVGDVDTASEFLGDDVAWIGLGDSPDVFAEGSIPFATKIESIECSDSSELATCDVTWSDLWIEAIPDLDLGAIRITAEIHDGQIVAFREWYFAPEVTRAFDAHIRWLGRVQPQELEEACTEDPGAASCSALLVNTVDAWIDATP